MVSWIRLPPGPNGEKVGLDDFLVRLEREGLSQEEIHERLFALAEPIETLLDELKVSSWREKDLRDILSGAKKPIEPTICAPDDGVALFYRERVNSLFGESTEGKTWVALFACKQEMDKGNDALYLDFEDNEYGITERLRAIGVSNETILELFHYVNPDTPFDEDARAEVVSTIYGYQAMLTLLIIDSAGESMALDGVRTNIDEDVSQWNRRFPKKIARQGPAVVMLDHVTKDPSTRRGSASGSHRKKDMINGSSFEVVGQKEFGRGQWGEARLICRKDRLGAHVRNRPAATFVLDARQSPYDVSLDPASSEEDKTTEAGFRPTILMERAAKTCEAMPGLSKTSIAASTKGNRQHLLLAVDLLSAEGYFRRDTKGHHYPERRYRQAEDPKLHGETAGDGKQDPV
jgi:hypothetical protein